MKEKIRLIFPQFIESIVNSYTQVFFSNSRIFAAILIIVSFFDIWAGLSGLIAVLSANATAYLVGFNRFNIKSGYYGFNPLLVGMGLGIYYNMGPEYLLVLLFASVLTLFITVMLEGVIGKYGLPYLSVSFLFGIWMVTMASRQFSALSISERGIFLSNELYEMGGSSFVAVYDWINSLNMHESVVIYFRSLGAIFFQYSIFAGFFISIGLLIYSRIAFMLSLIGFFSAYLFYQFVGGNIYELSYSYIGFNFILTSIAIGGFYLIPSKHSFLWVVLLIPLISITITSSMAVLNLFQLPIYSLPFNLIVLLFLYILKFRERFYNHPLLVFHQQFSPEKNLYSQINHAERFREHKFIPVLLPFWGEWTVTQGHDGEFTHKDGWAQAWDFEITDDEGSTYKGGGTVREDYYCYNKPVICPADGRVEEIVNNVEDNDIGDMNLDQNWGNTIIIRHDEKLFTKISHLKKDSFRVHVGESVKTGDILANCGNSGRSPEPHIHFQVQTTPFIGSKTTDYPIGHYILHNNEQFQFKSFSRPAKGDIVSNIAKNNTLDKAFHFVPGQLIKFRVKSSQEEEQKDVLWEVQSDMYNNTWLYCEKTNSRAWFRHEGNIHFFTHFEGDKKSLLFYFFLGAYKILTGFYKNIHISDQFPVHLLNRKQFIFLQDFIAPFFMFMKSEYGMEFMKMKDSITDSHVFFQSNAKVKVGNQVTRRIDFEFEIESKKIKKFVIHENNRRTEATEIATE
ncbi:MAG: urea transporter [Bacteroidales bacterium]|nr:urea transporter [Bacteroidales bacterium]